jgi:hypothetical protein
VFEFGRQPKPPALRQLRDLLPPLLPQVAEILLDQLTGDAQALIRNTSLMSLQSCGGKAQPAAIAIP